MPDSPSVAPACHLSDIHTGQTSEGQGLVDRSQNDGQDHGQDHNQDTHGRTARRSCRGALNRTVAPRRNAKTKSQKQDRNRLAMIAPGTVLLHDNTSDAGRSLLFTQPRRVLATCRLADVPALLAEAQSTSAAGLHPAGYHLPTNSALRSRNGLPRCCRKKRHFPCSGWASMTRHSRWTGSRRGAG